MKRTAAPKAPKDTSMYPWTSNYPPLKAWLELHKARCLAQTPTETREDRALDGFDYPTMYIEHYLFPNGRVAIVCVRAEQHGWDIFSNALTTEITATLADAEVRCDLPRWALTSSEVGK